MAKIRFEKSASLPTPGPIGRIVRVVPGIFLLYLFVLILSNYKDFIGSDLPRHPLLWLGIAVSFYILPEMLGIGLGRDFGRWPQLIFGLVALLAAVFDLVQYGALWGAATWFPDLPAARVRYCCTRDFSFPGRGIRHPWLRDESHPPRDGADTRT